MDQRYLFALALLPIGLGLVARSPVGIAAALLAAAAVFALGWQHMDGCIGGWLPGMPRLCK